ncbi:pimeloyl-ACP methyl ester carboxylesterase [Thermosporothrix hazakensis]|uniref:Pimeloyl-ACP methyl ester carboxylesterase n=2 Tax=Thermosporothrix TaxID=768650 RepID=A0A326U1Q3_THEHA|nr:alpha/beta hydrolase [Thermosporothrix hazakensis]PZW24026.1 pimeloyl-ACP methyl ester carboxylesterase [Thermosporothrix hazakensis]BBH87814.1 2-hydroxy-6-oxo-6-phenylhexa-2,4-dienoate hydrolase [Thermosporothrix sp. COM3]GCE50242.1 2-hydroxy-6-oxo-6-phenylhexa-2,4-dienoate hydrolase [Thermosporothrix hazakensis]
MQCVVRDLPLFYEVRGTGMPILCLHGFGCDHQQMTGCLEPLFSQQAGWQRIYLDLPGMGRTPGRDDITSSDDILALVLDFIDAVIGDQPFLLIGASYGGYLCQAILHQRFARVVGMALLCPGVLMERAQRDLPAQTVLVENPALLAELDAADAEEFASIAVVQDRAVWERFQREILSGAKLADEAFLQKISQRYSCSFDVRKLPQPFLRPVLLLTGRQDHVTGYRDVWQILENYPRGTFAVLDRAGHNLPAEQPHLFTALMHEWLERVQEALQKRDA